MHGWLGDEVEGVRMTSEYDDMTSGIDLVVSFYDEDKNRFVHLGIDATTTTDRSTIDKKFAKNFELFKEGKVPTVKYFEDPDGKKRRIFLPRVILGTDPESALEIQKMLVWKDKNEMTEKDAELESEVESLMLDLTEGQLAFFVYHLLRKRDLVPKLPQSRLKEINLQTALELIKEKRAQERLKTDEKLKNMVNLHLEVLEFIDRTKKTKSPKKSGKVNQPPYIYLLPNE